MNGCARATPITTQRTGANKNESTEGKYRVSLAGHHLDQKSLRAVVGKAADWNEIAKHSTAFANASGKPLLVWYLVQSAGCTQATRYFVDPGLQLFRVCHQRHPPAYRRRNSPQAGQARIGRIDRTRRRSLRRQLSLAAVLGGVMTRLSDNLRHIGDSWAIGSGRYASADPFNQRVVLPLPRASWAIEAYRAREEHA